MKSKKRPWDTLAEAKIGLANFRTSGAVYLRMLENLKANASKPDKDPLLDIFPDAGLKPGALTLLCAMPSIGKTTYLINVALGLAKKGKNVAVFLPDSTPTEFLHLAANIHSGNFFHKMKGRRGDIKALFNEFRAAAGRLPKTGLYLSRMTTMDQGDIERDVTDLAATLKADGRRLDVAIVDSLNYVKDEGYQLGPLSDLYNAAKKLQISRPV